jgi:hypothetical protein
VRRSQHIHLLLKSETVRQKKYAILIIYTQNIFILKVVFLLDGSPALTETISVTITVLDDNDASPQFIAAPYSASVPENSQANMTVLTVQAIDLDEVVLFNPNSLSFLKSSR